MRSRRDSKGITFIELNDGSRFKSMQLVVEAGAIAEETLKQITTGSSLEAGGALVESPAKGQAVELKVASVHVYGTADATTYPLQKKGHTLEFLREISHLRVRSNTFGAAFRVRNALTHAIHTFFQERDFLYVQTPIITTSDCEGAGQMFGVTTLNLQQPPRAADGKVDWQQDFFAKPAYLTVSGQLEGEIFASAFSKVYTFRPDVSRREQQYAAPLGRVLDDRAGDGFLRARRQHAAGRGVFQVHYSLRARTLPRRFGVLQSIHREVGPGDFGACRRVQLRPHHLHRGDSPS